MKIKFSDSAETVLDVFSINETFRSETQNTLIDINILNPTQNLEYYKTKITDAAIKNMELQTNSGEPMGTLKGQKLAQISRNYRDEGDGILTIEISA